MYCNRIVEINKQREKYLCIFMYFYHHKKSINVVTVLLSNKNHNHRDSNWRHKFFQPGRDWLIQCTDQPNSLLDSGNLKVIQKTLVITQEQTSSISHNRTLKFLKWESKIVYFLKQVHSMHAYIAKQQRQSMLRVS